MIYSIIEGLIQQATKNRLIESADQIYVRNQVIALLNLDSIPEEMPEALQDIIPNLLEEVIAYAVEQQLIEDFFDEKEIFAANIMNCFVARPSDIQTAFYKKYEVSPKAATDYFYSLSKNSNYIQMNRIKKNIHFKAETAYGKLDITINLSKPEKDPEQLKRERQMKQSISFPKCLLCVENEGQR